MKTRKNKELIYLKRFILFIIIFQLGCAARLKIETHQPSMAFSKDRFVECKFGIGELQITNYGGKLTKISLKDNERGQVQTITNEIRKTMDMSQACLKSDFQEFENAEIPIVNGNLEASLNGYLDKNFISKDKDKDKEKENLEAVFFLVSEMKYRHPPLLLPAFLYVTIHLVTLGLVPLWSSESAELWVLNRDREIHRISKSNSIWFWSPWRLTSDWLPSQDAFRIGSKQILESAVAESFEKLKGI